MNTPPLAKLKEALAVDNTEGSFNGRWSAGVPNVFYQRVGNSLVWVLQWTAQGKLNTMGLGPASRDRLKEVGRLITKYKEIIKAGGDPRAARDEERKAVGLKPVRAKHEPTSMTFRDVTRAFLADRADSWKSDDTEGHFAKQMRDYAYPVIADVPIQNIAIDHVAEVLKPIWRTRRPTAVKLRSRIGQVLDWAEAKGWRSGGNPARSKAIISLVGNGRHHPQHFRAIHYSQLPAFWKRIALADERYPDVADALRLQLLTATRPSDATAAEWSEFDFENRVWTIPAERMKMGREHRVPLSDAAMEVLERRRAATPDSRFVFPGAKPDQPIGRQSLLKLIKRLGVDATAHGTARSSCREWAAEVDGQGVEICEATPTDRHTSPTAAFGSAGTIAPAAWLRARRAACTAGTAGTASDPVQAAADDGRHAVRLHREWRRYPSRPP
jgi:integrase